MRDKKLAMLVGAIVVLAVGYALLRFTSGGAGLLSGLTADHSLFLPLVAITAFVDSLNPCAISVLLITIAFLVGLGKARSNVLMAGGSYIFGIFLTYVLIGVGILSALVLFGIPNFVGRIGAAIIILVGLISMLNHFFPEFPIRLRLPARSKPVIAQLMERGTVPMCFVLGVAVGLFEFPCTGGPYLLILSLLHTASTRLLGAGYLALYNTVFVLPLIVLLLLASNATILAQAQEWRKSNTGAMRVWGGLAMVLIGLLIFAA